MDDLTSQPNQTPTPTPIEPTFAGGVASQRPETPRTLWLIVALLIVVALGLGWLVWQNQALTPSPIDTPTWQTYRNEKYGFEFKYPIGLKNMQDVFGPSGSLYLYLDFDDPDPSDRLFCAPFCLYAAVINIDSQEAAESCNEGQSAIYSTDIGSWQLFTARFNYGNIGSDFVDAETYQAACLETDERLYRFRLSADSSDLESFAKTLTPTFKKILDSVKFI